MEENNINQLILNELRVQTRCSRQSTLMGVIAIIVLVIFTVIVPFQILNIKHKNKDTVLSWNQVQHLLDQSKYDEALKVAHSILQKTSGDWYSNSYVASIYSRKGDIVNAEKYYTIAYELFPSENNEKMLIAIRKHINSDHTGEQR